MSCPWLPEEIIANIFASLPVVTVEGRYDLPKDNKTTLATLHSISLVSRSFQRMVNPVLYGTVVFVNGNLCTLHDFLRTLLARRDHARSVKSLTIAYSSPKLDPDQPDDDLETVYSDMRLWLTSVLNDGEVDNNELVDDEFDEHVFKYEQFEYWGYDMKRGLKTSLWRIATNDIAYFVLLGLCRELDTLEIDLWDFCSTSAWSNIRRSLERQHYRGLASIGQSMQYFPRLRSLTLSIDPAFVADDYRDHDNMPDLAPFLLIPSLRKLHCLRLDFYHRDGEPPSPGGTEREIFLEWLSDHSHSNVRELYLSDCTVPQTILLPLLEFMPDLERLHFTTTDPWSLSSNCDLMASLIQEYRDPLRELRFDIHPRTPKEARHANCKVHNQPWCNLSESASLEVIGIPSPVLHGTICEIPSQHRQNPLAWMLPYQNLHTLELREYGWSDDLPMIHEALRALMKDVRFSTLTRIELSTNLDWHKPISDYPQETLPSGWTATTIVKTLSKFPGNVYTDPNEHVREIFISRTAEQMPSRP
jgi:hypothetical protein